MKALLTFIGLALSMTVHTAEKEVARTVPDAANGKRLFLSVGCYQCHGTQGAGGGIFGPSLAPKPLPTEALTALVRHPRGRMPAYSDVVLSDSQIADIASYLRSIPKGKATSEIPMLSR